MYVATAVSRSLFIMSHPCTCLDYQVEADHPRLDVLGPHELEQLAGLVGIPSHGTRTQNRVVADLYLKNKKGKIKMKHLSYDLALILGKLTKLLFACDTIVVMLL